MFRSIFSCFLPLTAAILLGMNWEYKWKSCSPARSYYRFTSFLRLCERKSRTWNSRGQSSIGILQGGLMEEGGGSFHLGNRNTRASTVFSFLREGASHIFSCSSRRVDAFARIRITLNNECQGNTTSSKQRGGTAHRKLGQPIPTS